MSFRYPKGGFITAFYDPLQVPNAPTSVSATGGDAEATVTFTAPANVGGSAITGYVAQSVPGGLTATGSASPLTVTGLSNGTAYTINVAAINSYGPGPYGTSGSVTPQAVIGLFGGGNSGSATNVIEYISISTTGNATDFGDLTVVRASLAAFASSTRGVWAGGAGAGVQNVIDYVTIASAGNATDFGDLTGGLATDNGKIYELTGCSSSTRGLTAGGQAGGARINVIQYVTIASVGNSTDFGDLTQTRSELAGCSSSTIGVFGGGTTGDYTNVIDYVTIASTGNATDFGDLTVARRYLAGCSSSTRGLFGGGFANAGYQNTIDYITIASAGNATDFGDLTNKPNETSACSSSIRGVWGGGFVDTPSSQRTNVIQYVTIASTGNALDFGDLTVATTTMAGCSNGHGGL